MAQANPSPSLTRIGAWFLLSMVLALGGLLVAPPAQPVLSAAVTIPGSSPTTAAAPVLSFASHPLSSQWNLPQGADPGSISLSWTQSTDSCFGGYTFAYYDPIGGPGGGWHTVAAGQYPRNVTTWWTNNLPNNVREWELADATCTGSATYSFFNYSLPVPASLTCSALSPTSVTCRWNNDALYGGMLSFYSYQLSMQGPTGGAYVVATIPYESTLSYTINGLSPDQLYRFDLTTMDECVGSWVCGVTGPTDYFSNSTAGQSSVTTPAASSSSNSTPSNSSSSNPPPTGSSPTNSVPTS